MLLEPKLLWTVLTHQACLWRKLSETFSTASHKRILHPDSHEEGLYLPLSASATEGCSWLPDASASDPYDSEPTHSITTRTLPLFPSSFQVMWWVIIKIDLLETDSSEYIYKISTPPVSLESLIQCLYSSQSRAWGLKAAGWSQTRKCRREDSLVMAETDTCAPVCG